MRLMRKYDLIYLLKKLVQLIKSEQLMSKFDLIDEI